MTRWERFTEPAIVVLSAVFLAAYAWPILEPSLDPAWVRLCDAAVWFVWFVFVVEYVVRLSQAEDRRRWFFGHLLDLAIIALPMLRPLRLLRLVSLLRVLNRTAMSSLRGQVGLYVAAGSSLLAFVAALAVLDAERDAPGGNITSFGDGLWWACTTMATVGYGDQFPVTTTGRFVGVGLMIAGIALLGTVTATLASWLVDAVSSSLGEAEDTRQDAELDDLRHQMSALTDELRLLRSDAGVSDSADGDAERR